MKSPAAEGPNGRYLKSQLNSKKHIFLLAFTGILAHVLRHLRFLPEQQYNEAEFKFIQWVLWIIWFLFLEKCCC